MNYCNLGIFIKNKQANTFWCYVLVAKRSGIIMEDKIHVTEELVEEFVQVVKFKLDPEEILGQINITTV